MIELRTIITGTGLPLLHLFYLITFSACAPVHDRVPGTICKELHPVESCHLHLHEQNCEYNIVVHLKDSKKKISVPNWVPFAPSSIHIWLLLACKELHSTT